MLNKVIGIISYLPDDPEIRMIRKERLSCLLVKCKELLDLPIIIIAQNWKDDKIENKDITIYNYYNKLGITGARKELRKIFLASSYDYLIMLDDDSELCGTKIGSGEYLDQIEQHPGMWGIFYTNLLKLFAISKEVYSLVNFPDLEPDQGDFFEDMWLTNYVNKKYPQLGFRFKKSDFMEKSDSAHDICSTWYYGQFNKHDIGDKTREMIRRIGNE